jgi:hypothetical protein
MVSDRSLEYVDRYGHALTANPGGGCNGGLGSHGTWT